jgi:hypothetical protein
MIVKDRDLSELDEQEWDDFIRLSNNGTLFSEARFFHHHDHQHNVRFISCHDGIDILAGVVGRFEEDKFISPTSASYGGLIILSLSFEQTEKAVLAIMEYFKDIGIRKISMTFPPIAYNKEINQNLDFLLRYYGFSEKQALISSITDTTGYSEKSLSSMCRRAVKKSFKKNIEVRPVTNIDNFYPILKGNKAKFNLEPTHSKEEINSLIQLYPDRIELLGAYKDNKLLAGVMNMKCTDNVILTFYIASDYQYQKLRPVNRLLHETCMKAKNNNIRYVDFGVSMETDTDNPMDPRRSLIYFKEHFNSRGYLRSRFEWSDQK